MSTMVGIAVKNSALWLPKFLEELEKLEDVSRVVWIYGKSRDQTLEIIQNWSEVTQHEVELYLEPPMKARTAHQIAPVYGEMQEIMTEGDESHFLLIDCDVMRFPPNLITHLKEHDKDIIAPYVWDDGFVPDKFFDTYCFRYEGARFHPFDPPNPGKPFQLDSIGTCYLATRKAFAFTPYGERPHRSFCLAAKEMGFEVWADPTINIYHLDVQRLGIPRIYPEAVEGLPPDMTPYIKKDGTLVPLEQMAIDMLYALIWKEIR